MKYLLEFLYNIRLVLVGWLLTWYLIEIIKLAYY